jgi:hypothetical protein
MRITFRDVAQPPRDVVGIGHSMRSI